MTYYQALLVKFVGVGGQMVSPRHGYTTVFGICFDSYLGDVHIYKSLEKRHFFFLIQFIRSWNCGVYKVTNVNNSHRLHFLSCCLVYYYIDIVVLRNYI